MVVVLDDNNRPQVWGDGINGRDIPDPPTPARDYRWDDGRGEWVEDPIATRQEELDAALRAARANDDLQAQVDALAAYVRGEDIPAASGTPSP